MAVCYPHRFGLPIRRGLDPRHFPLALRTRSEIENDAFIFVSVSLQCWRVVKRQRKPSFSTSERERRVSGIQASPSKTSDLSDGHRPGVRSHLTCSHMRLPALTVCAASHLAAAILSPQERGEARCHLISPIARFQNERHHQRRASFSASLTGRSARQGDEGQHWRSKIRAVGITRRRCR